MDYEKKYKEALKVAKEMYASVEGMKEGDVLEEIFPEFKECKGEKIRKALLEMVHDTTGDSLRVDYDVHKEDAIAWLEKQGEHANFLSKIQVGDKVTRNEDGELVNLSQLNRVAKPDDKVKPKFHEGEWITNGDYTWKIVEVKPLDYILQSQDGNIVDDTISHVDEQFHSFSIEDAKDCDVLCTYECCEPKIVFILKGIPKKHYALSYHCYYNIMYPHFESDSKKGCLALNDEDVKPATKEQRDTLEKAMSDAGWEFNFDKRELKEIKPDEWSKEDEKTWEELIEEVEDQLDSVPAPDCRVKEDEKVLKQLNKWLTWLKSLKDRHTWKPSEEQLSELKNVFSPDTDSWDEDILRELYEQLKQL